MDDMSCQGKEVVRGMDLEGDESEEAHTVGKKFIDVGSHHGREHSV